LWDIIKTVKSQGRTIVLTTHYMEEAEKLCDDIAIMDKGKVIARGAPHETDPDPLQRATLSVPKDQFPKNPGDLQGIHQ
jgi:ABC-2 type transport system ATP-binding protein